MRIFVALCLLTLVSPEVMAEVSDKAASHLQLWVEGIVVGGLALVAGVFRPVLGILIGLLFGLLFGYAAYDTFVDPYIGPAVLAEQGEIYRVSVYASPTLCVLGAFIGAFFGLRSRHFLGERRAAS
jgi:hypothetical protein